MASKKSSAEISVKELVEELKENPSTRFSQYDFQTLVFGVLADKDFRAKKYLLKADGIEEEEVEFNSGLKRFLDKLLKHAGMADSTERSNVIDTFEYNAKDVEWITGAVDEAMAIYTDCDKNMRMFRDKMLQLTIRKMKRSGKYDGQITFKKMVVDRQLALAKKAKSKQ